jgi:RNA polymerase sigma-70 factor (ECF subfamily)
MPYVLMSGGSDAELAAGLAARDVDALAQLYDRYGGLAYSIALRVLSDPGRAEDVVQESFLKLWNSAERYDSARGSLRTWLITAVRNRSIDYLRGRAAHERQEREIPAEQESTGPGSDPWFEVASSIERDLILEAIASLPAEQRQAVELAYFGGYTHREIADMASVPISTIKGRMRLALEKLQSYLQGRGVAYER